MIPDLQRVPAWILHLAATSVTLLVAWSVGHLINAVLTPRIARWARQTRGTWDEAVIQTVTPRVPWWCLLVGVWLSLSYWPLNPQARTLGERVVFVLAVASVTFAAAAISSRLVADYGARVAPSVPVTTFSKNLVWAVIVAFGALAVLSALGVSITPMITAFGIGGLAVALALQDPLANFFAGLIITLTRHVQVGNHIRLDTGIEGEVVDFSWRLTRIRIVTGKFVLIPNARLAQSIVTNYSLPTPEIPVPVEMGVDAASNLSEVEQLLIDVGRQVTADVVNVYGQAPVVRFHTFGNGFVKLTVWLTARDLAGQQAVVHEFTKRVQAQFQQRGIVLRM